MRKTSRMGRKLLIHPGRFAFAADAVGVYRTKSDCLAALSSLRFK